MGIEWDRLAHCMCPMVKSFENGNERLGQIKFGYVSLTQ